MIVRTANLKDADQLDSLLELLIRDECQYDKTLDSSFKVKDFYKNVLQKEGHRIYLCEEKEKIVGYIYIIQKDEKTAKIDALFVLEAYRKRNIASTLLDTAISYLKERKIEIIEISVMAQNSVAKHLYLTKGFQPFKEYLHLEIK